MCGVHPRRRRGDQTKKVATSRVARTQEKCRVTSTNGMSEITAENSERRGTHATRERMHWQGTARADQPALRRGVWRY